MEKKSPLELQTSSTTFDNSSSPESKDLADTSATFDSLIGAAANNFRFEIPDFKLS
jgi:hypothetical protein